MLRTVVAVLILAAVADRGHSADGPVKPIPEVVPERIIGGSTSNIIPYQLSLRSYNTHTCGAVIISAYWAVTSAHCTAGGTISSLTLLAGTTNRLSGGALYRISRIVNHPLFDQRTHNNDIALLKVSVPFNFNDLVHPIPLAYSGQTPTTGSAAMVSGWGSFSTNSPALSTYLQSVVIPVIDNSTCNKLLNGRITANMLCAGPLTGGKDACAGDGGGPLVVNGFLHGIVSWGVGCAQRNSPGVYTNVSALRLWIASVTGV
ncbi:trypsin-1-like [Orussus abietinus]|uniref:trypsin-1-like n=1 Tax=Orussus abietinus TaxID=222816 RepID=UPI0006262894|nr:trypsin-1-like [Orussus abietinus]